MSPKESGKAALQYRRNQSLNANVKSLEAVGRAAMQAFLAVWLLGSEAV